MRKGTHHSEATKARISAAKSGKPQSPKLIAHRFVEGQPPWNKGKSTPVEVRKKLSEANKGQVPWNKGKKVSDEVRKKLSEAHRGIPSPKRGKPGKKHTKESREKISASLQGITRSEETRAKISAAMKGNTHFAGHKHTKETKKKNSEAHQGEKHWAWRGGISFEPYCPKFNNAKKEAVRAKFGRTCFYCGLPESENKSKSGKVRKLSVHHVHYAKDEGCNGEMMVLLPLCIQCHAKTTSGDRLAWMQKLSEKLQCYEGDNS